MNAPFPAGAGAMLARLIGLGRRCGLAPEAVLLHVLDGAPLPETESELLRNIAQEMAGLPEQERPDVHPATLIRKGDRAVHLYGTTALSNPAIGRLIESTPQTVSWFIRKARDRGDPLVAAGDRMRGRVEGDAPADATGEAIPGEVDPSPADGAEDASLTLPLRDEEENDGLVFEFPEADPALGPGAQERLDSLNERQFATILGDAAGTAAAENAVERPSVDALPARQDEAPGRETPSAKAVNVAGLTKSEAALELWAKTDLSYIEIAWEIGSTSGSVYERIRQGKKRGDTRWADGFARRNPSAGSQPDEASGGGEHEVAQQPVQDAIAGAAGEPTVGADPVAPSLVPASFSGVPFHVDAAAGETMNSPEGASEVAGEPEVVPPASDLAEHPAPLPDPTPVEKGTVRRASGSAVRPARPGPDPETPKMEAELPDDQVVAVNAGWIIGPAGTIKGFPLVNAVLQVLADGSLVAVATIAERAGARSAAAVQAILGQWRSDIERIGVEIVHFGGDIRLRRAGAQ